MSETCRWFETAKFCVAVIEITAHQYPDDKRCKVMHGNGHLPHWSRVNMLKSQYKMLACMQCSLPELVASSSSSWLRRLKPLLLSVPRRNEATRRLHQEASAGLCCSTSSGANCEEASRLLSIARAPIKCSGLAILQDYGITPGLRFAPAFLIEE